MDFCGEIKKTQFTVFVYNHAQICWIQKDNLIIRYPWIFSQIEIGLFVSTGFLLRYYRLFEMVLFIINQVLTDKI